VLALRNTTLEETLASATQIGRAIGMAAEGAMLERKLRAKLAAIERQNAGTRRTLLFIVGRTPGRLDGMIAVGSGSYLNDVIQIAGGRNVLSDSKVAYPRITLEAVMRLDPDVIVDMGDMAETVGVSDQHKRAVVGLWERQPEVRAVKQKKVFAVAADIFVVPGPRVTDAAEAFAAMMHGRAAQ
jgi:iron complex transport system substrate-binding protein